MRMDWPTFHFVVSNVEGGYKLYTTKDTLLNTLSI